ncbi:hypothetical protein BFW38_04500 [Terasakiispira papahanaumokuakeensis]|uniref:Uncharacterized protein n=2 Tax=Terasakiispira papahanaumokuakeensis TaxID=197479 RepID=A0A1E2V7U3_9GAMM|nr:hypothetical protein BFW38_04500 [Terasakiispira papahanaumokuakeensis]
MTSRGMPQEEDFPKGTAFYIFEWDVPLSKEPNADGQTVSYFNWFGGEKKPYPIERLKIDNHWPADSYAQWIKVIEASL